MIFDGNGMYVFLIVISNVMLVYWRCEIILMMKLVIVVISFLIME